MKKNISLNPGARPTVRYDTIEERERAVKESYLRRRYNLSLKEYEAMLAGQNGLCKICGRPDPKGRKLHVDHDHNTGAVRGLLCQGCNFGLGGFQDNPELLLEAVKYILRSKR